MPEEELSARLMLYRQWRDESMISLPPERAEALFGAELEQARERVTERGALKVDKKGRARPLRPLRFEDEFDPSARKPEEVSALTPAQ